MKVKTCLRYPGGKFYGVEKILPFFAELPLFDEIYDEYREPFIGGGSVFLAKELAKKNWINDKDSELINFYLVIQQKSSCQKLYELLENEYVDKERYQQVRNLKPKNEIERAFKYFYLNRTSFSGIMRNPRWGYMLGSSVTPEKWIGRIMPVAEKLKGVKITCLDFKDLLSGGNKKVLCYVDPPYFQASADIYSVNFSEKDHFDLRDILKEAKFRFVLSYNQNNQIEKMYSWANIKNESWVYFMSEERRLDGKELIISNY